MVDLDHQNIPIGSDLLDIKVNNNAKVADDFWNAIPNYCFFLGRPSKIGIETIMKYYDARRFCTPPFTIKFLTKCAFRRQVRKQSARWLVMRNLYAAEYMVLPSVLCTIIQQYI
jgi:hypothetical protein